MTGAQYKRLKNALDTLAIEAQDLSKLCTPRADFTPAQSAKFRADFEAEVINVLDSIDVIKNLVEVNH